MLAMSTPCVTAASSSTVTTRSGMRSDTSATSPESREMSFNAGRSSGTRSRRSAIFRSTDEPLVIHGHGDHAASGVVVFIHGLGGSRYGDRSTWGRLPEFLFDDVPDVDVALYAYRTGVRRLFRRSQSIELERESHVLDDLLRDLDDYEWAALVGHSMDGISAEAALFYVNRTNQHSGLQRVPARPTLSSAPPCVIPHAP